MTTKEYVEKYQLHIFNKKFDKEELLADLYKDFYEMLTQELTDYVVDPKTKVISKGSNIYTENKFCQVVEKIKQKFWSISNKRNGFAFTDAYWGKFYFLYIHKVRLALYPKKIRKTAKS